MPFSEMGKSGGAESEMEIERDGVKELGSVWMFKCSVAVKLRVGPGPAA